VSANNLRISKLSFREQNRDYYRVELESGQWPEDAEIVKACDPNGKGEVKKCMLVAVVAIFKGGETK
jgi:acyl-CoA synthetase (AMP-forming)/AMP-acid ligase II